MPVCDRVFAQAQIKIIDREFFALAAGECDVQI